MTFLPLALLFVGVGTVAALVDRRLQRRKQAPEAAEPGSESRAAAATAAMTGGLKDWYGRIVHKTPADLPQRFRVWCVSAAADDTAVKDWLNQLSDENLQAFIKHLLVPFCSDMGFELSSLVEQSHDKNPEWVQAAERIVLHYCRACQQATIARDDFEAHKRILEFERNPSSKKNVAFGEMLFARLIEKQLASGSTSEYLGQSPGERRQRVLKAIDEAVTKDSAAYDLVVKEVMLVEEGKPAAAETAAASTGQKATASAAESQ